MMRKKLYEIDFHFDFSPVCGNLSVKYTPSCYVNPDQICTHHLPMSLKHGVDSYIGFFECEFF